MAALIYYLDVSFTYKSQMFRVTIHLLHVLTILLCITCNYCEPTVFVNDGDRCDIWYYRQNTYLLFLMYKSIRRCLDKFLCARSESSPTNYLIISDNLCPIMRILPVYSAHVLTILLCVACNYCDPTVFVNDGDRCDTYLLFLLYKYCIVQNTYLLFLLYKSIRRCLDKFLCARSESSPINYFIISDNLCPIMRILPVYSAHNQLYQSSVSQVVLRCRKIILMYLTCIIHCNTANMNVVLWIACLIYYNLSLSSNRYVYLCVPALRCDYHLCCACFLCVLATCVVLIVFVCSCMHSPLVCVCHLCSLTTCVCLLHYAHSSVYSIHNQVYRSCVFLSLLCCRRFLKMHRTYLIVALFACGVAMLWMLEWRYIIYHYSMVAYG